MQYHANQLLVEMCQGTSGRETESSCLLPLEVDIRWDLVQSYSHLLQLVSQQFFLNLSLSSIQHHYDQIGCPCDCYHLSPSPLSLRSSLYDTREIQKLDVSFFIPENLKLISKYFVLNIP